MSNSMERIMDEAAANAALELPEGAGEVGDWVRKHYLRAGYKRLCKVLMSATATKVDEEERATGIEAADFKLAFAERFERIGR